MKLEENVNLAYEFITYDNMNNTIQLDYIQPAIIFTTLNPNDNVNILQVYNNILPAIDPNANISILQMDNNNPPTIDPNANINILQVENNIPPINTTFLNDLDFLQNASGNILNRNDINFNNKNKKLLIFDLDETLVYCSSDPSPNKDSIVLTLEIDEEPLTVYVNKRPYVDEFLSETSLYYDLVIFSASLSDYVYPLNLY